MAATLEASRMALNPGRDVKSLMIITSSRTRAPGKPSRKEAGFPGVGDQESISARGTPAIASASPRDSFCTARFSLSFDVRPRMARARFSENRASLAARLGSRAVNASTTAANVFGGSNPPLPSMRRRGALNFAGTRPTSSSNGRGRSNRCNSVMLSRANPVPADMPFRPSAMCVIAPSRKHASTTNALLP